MSDLLIKNKDVPKSCGECPLVLEYFSKFENKNVIHCQARLEGESRFVDGFDFSTRSEHCPLVEVKSHGRLIDADRLRQVMENATENDKDKPFYKMMYSYVIQVLAESPTVLESSDGYTD